jgi:hypothetical protein
MHEMKRTAGLSGDSDGVNAQRWKEVATATLRQGGDAAIAKGQKSQKTTNG